MCSLYSRIQKIGPRLLAWPRILFDRTPNPRQLIGSSQEQRGASTSSGDTSSSPVNSFNEWDPLEEVIVGRPEGMRVPFLHPDLKVKVAPKYWKYVVDNAGRPHEADVVKQAAKEVDEFINILKQEGVTVRRPDVIPWDTLGEFNTPFYKDGGYCNSMARDGLLVVGDEIIEAAMGWRSRMFEVFPYRRLLNEYFKKGASWTAAPRPTMRDELYVQDFPFEDKSAREKLAADGQYILTEEEVVFDAADFARFGTDIFALVSNTTNRNGVEWIRRHLAPKGFRVHTCINKGISVYHIDVSLIPLKPGVVLVNPNEPMIRLNDITEPYDWFSRQGWTVVEAPPSAVFNKTNVGRYVCDGIFMNTLSLDAERLVVQKGELPLIKKLTALGFQPIEVDMRTAVHLGGAFHCWTCDIRRRGTKETYFDI